MDIENVSAIIHAIASGFEDSVLECMDGNKKIVGDLVREQLWCGVDGTGEYLSPSYDDDPYFDEKGPWQGRAQAYKEWKKRITPPSSGVLTRLGARPSDIPNLFIDGTFHDSIRTAKEKDGLLIYTAGFRDGPSIERKYGENIFNLTAESTKFFIDEKLVPHLERFYKVCGYEL